MDEGTPLQGGCSCGRNHYVIFTPPSPLHSLQLLLDDQSGSRRTLSLRVPLTSLQTTTEAYFPDETHNAIRRIFTPRHAPHTKRHFCGFCGTQLTHWSEQPPNESQFICVNLDSLYNESMNKLEDVGVLAGVSDEDGEPAATANSQAVAASNGREFRGNPWFEEIIEGSELGKIRRRKGKEQSADGRRLVSWEVVEFEGEDADAGSGTSGKRKLGSLAETDDTEMRGG